MQVRDGQFNKPLQKIKEYRSWGRQSGGVGTLIDCVDDNVNWLLCGNKEHLVKTISQVVNVGLFCAVPVCPINTGNYLATGVQVVRKLNEKRFEKVMNVLLFLVSKVKEVLQWQRLGQSGTQRKKLILRE
jgi:hypothetical protein